jgi:hypothetical protein
MLRWLWTWLITAECEMTGCRNRVERIGPFGARRRVCIYCRDCAPEFYDAG